MFFVKTVYSDSKPNITRYTSKETAEAIITAYKNHGIDIVSCEFIEEEVALAEVRAQKVEYDRA